MLKAIQREIVELEKIANRAQEDIATARDCSLSVSRSHGVVQYYKRDSTGRRSYISKEDMEQTALYAQADYARKVLRVIRMRQEQLQSLLMKHCGRSAAGSGGSVVSKGKPIRQGSALVLLEDGRRIMHEQYTCTQEVIDVYSRLSEERKCLVEPYALTDQQFVSQWLSEVAARTGLPAEGLEYMTQKGHLVRSKSEVIIADRLHQAGLLYRYEQPVCLGDGGRVVHPDFLVLNPTTRRECLWEHFGMMQDANYCNHALSKMARYSAAGLVLGKNYIATFESASNHLDITAVELAIEEILKS